MNPKKKIAVTGGTGKTGRYVVSEFLKHGYEVINIDLDISPDAPGIPQKVNLTNLGQVFNALTGAEAVVHIAAIPRPRGFTSQVVYQNNVISTYNIYEACSALHINNLVVASSESVYGLAYGGPSYVPIDEDHPKTPLDSYALSKIVNETSAEMFSRKTGMQIVSFRIGNVMEESDYQRFPQFYLDAQQRKNIVWSYIDARDVASACRLAVETDGLGAVVMNLAADDSSMAINSCILMEQAYPDVTDIRDNLEGFETLLSNKRAKKLLGWCPSYKWRDYVNEP